ncbi:MULTISPECIES: RbsD/FucU domain-containing protein [unclassified Mesorhizobium]|uniref:RbsD/FucU domain-containing protein n=1 Tax=unclassified Mesorhizobium TaxID=325217 RepID=UPI000FE48765|nr:MULTISPECIES: RbsD/FucU domain-containing protein [unclassified Mesorhizobium]RWB73255.1 MAG: D-ribose pyranase [Mesorhizobium sp.]RWB90825.1 MAG: D-ribose pyranase [Mesorhizobium sp.]TGS64078.1 D-ribose pyranase [Mesorhizobium sp. M3A.F.Ca.ET.201.01.1.1]TGS85802.1 D-ribose pyranase [Mesorhizobium sp. M3A.F.Ca.ET.175.01.1.1]TGT23888.1 D-ribose pyranase [Mesorhizobium sp. M3A.F.Ca.ET.174.01.1.1]
MTLSIKQADNIIDEKGKHEMQYGADNRIINGTIAAALATLRHGEVIFIADAGGVIASSVQVPIVDLGIAPGLVSIEQLLPLLRDNGDIERAVVAEPMEAQSPQKYKFVVDTFGKERVTTVPYRPSMYAIRNASKLIIRTGDYSVHGNIALVGGYASADVKFIRNTEVGDIRILPD